MGAGARESNVPQNPYTQQAAGQGYKAVQDFGQMQNFPMTANNAYVPTVYNQTLFNPSGYDPSHTVNVGNQISAEGANLIDPATQTMMMGLDPQMAQFNFYDQKMADAARAANAAAGIGTTPWGAAVEGQDQSNFINQWALAQSQKADAALQAGAGAYGTATGMQGLGQQVAQSAPAFQSGELGQLLSALEQNYTFPQANLSNQMTYMGQANAQNQTAVQSAAQQAQAAQMNSPWAFLGSLSGGLGGSFMKGAGQTLGSAAGLALLA